MIKIRLPDGTECTIRDMQWTAPDHRIAALLNDVIAAEGPSPGDPFPERAEARHAIGILGGEIIYVAAPEPDGSPGEITQEEDYEH